MINEKEVGINFHNDIKEHIYVAAICDILDELGYRNQAMHQRLRPSSAGYKELWIYRKGENFCVEGSSLCRRRRSIRAGNRSNGFA